ncbi:MAG TPA: acyloxyacyl hydrolase [Gemmatimonadaceae bacterium]|nr:acyloxyacyl hydrolase [Gemmatimonadaceae bacterium]
MPYRIVCPGLLVALLTTSIAAQGPVIGLTFSAAVATNSTAGAAIDRQFYQAAVSAGWTIAGGRDVALAYVPAVIPLAITTHDANYQYVPPVCTTPPCTNDLGGGTSIVTYHTVYGAGITPLSLDLALLRRSPASIVIGAGGGVLWFTRAVPQNDAAKFNFTAEGRAALQFRASRHLALRLGYAYHHTSNAHSGAANPGLNSSMITAGVFRTP